MKGWGWWNLRGRSWWRKQRKRLKKEMVWLGWGRGFDHLLVVVVGGDFHLLFFTLILHSLRTNKAKVIRTNDCKTSMKSSLKKLRGLALHNHNHNRTRKDDSSNSIQPLGQLDELARATQARTPPHSHFSFHLCFFNISYPIIQYISTFRVWRMELIWNCSSGYARHEGLLWHLAFRRCCNRQQCLW